MSEATRARLAAASRIVLLCLWAAEVIGVASGTGINRVVAIAGLSAYAAIAVWLARIETLRLALPLAGIAIALAVMDGRPQLIGDGIAFAHTFPAFLATIMLVRALSTIHPAIGLARARVATLSDRDRASGFLLASHMLGAVVTAGAAAVLAPLVRTDADDQERARLATLALRGSSLAALWSPFFVGMAFVTQYVPSVPLYTVAIMGIGLAALAMVISMAPGGLSAFRGLGRALLALWPLTPPVAVAALLIIVAATLLHLRSLETVLLVMPPLVGAWLLTRPRQDRKTALRAGWQHLGRLNEEMLVMIAVTMISRTLAGVSWTSVLASPLHAGWLPPVVLLGVLVLLIILIAMMGVHPMATVAVILALLTDGPMVIAPLALVGMGLLGWGLGAMLSPTSLSLLIASTSFGVPRARLVYGANITFTIAFGTAAVLVMGMVDYLTR